MSRPLLAQTVVPAWRPLIQEALRDGLLDAVEIAPDDFFSPEGSPGVLARVLDGLGAPYSFHFTKLSLGSADFPSRHEQLESAARAIRGFSPLLVSDHLSVASVGSFSVSGRLPCIYDEAALLYVSENVRAAAAALAPGRFIIENVTSEFEFAASTMSSELFTLEIVARTGCGLLLDLHNVCVQERRTGLDAVAFLDSIPSARVREIHVASGRMSPECGELSESDGSSMWPRICELLEYALMRFSPELVVLECDPGVDDHARITADLERLRELLG